MSQSNPFATRFIRPGAIEFLFPQGQTLELLLGQLRADDWCGQIVGPHGSGKSTLLAALMPAIAAAGRRIEAIRIQKSASRGQKVEFDSKSIDANTQVIVDGFEQLSWFRRRKITQACRRQGAGLLITAHADLGLPTLFRTEPTAELARAIVSRLLPAGDVTIDEADIVCAYNNAQASIRETLFHLYDVYQQRHSARR